MGFKAVGLDVLPAVDDKEALEILNKLIDGPDEYAIIYIEETLAVNMQKEIDKYKESPVPAIILIPGREGSVGLRRRPADPAGYHRRTPQARPRSARRAAARPPAQRRAGDQGSQARHGAHRHGEKRH